MLKAVGPWGCASQGPIFWPVLLLRGPGDVPLLCHDLRLLRPLLFSPNVLEDGCLGSPNVLSYWAPHISLWGRYPVAKAYYTGSIRSMHLAQVTAVESRVQVERNMSIERGRLKQTTDTPPLLFT